MKLTTALILVLLGPAPRRHGFPLSHAHRSKIQNSQILNALIEHAEGMIVANDQRLADRAHVQLLPPHWGTLYELTKLPDDVFAAKLAGRLHPS